MSMQTAGTLLVAAVALTAGCLSFDGLDGSKESYEEEARARQDSGVSGNDATTTDAGTPPSDSGTTTDGAAGGDAGGDATVASDAAAGPDADARAQDSSVDAGLDVGSPIDAVVAHADNPCSDGTVEQGASFWGRADIAFCSTNDGSLPDIAAARALCSVGWHLCTSPEYQSRNDLCPPHAYRFSAVLDDGQNCMVHDSMDQSLAYKCNLDGVRQGYSGSCTGPISSSFSMLNRDNFASGVAPQGAMCCR